MHHPDDFRLHLWLKAEDKILGWSLAFFRLVKDDLKHALALLFSIIWHLCHIVNKNQAPSDVG